MLPYFWYILKVMICSGILFGYYWLFLRNKIFHQYNRFYLLSAIAISLLLPLMKVDFWQPQHEQSQAIRVLQAVSAGDEYISKVIITASKENWSMQQLYPALYWMVSLIFFLVLLHTLFIIRSLLKKYPVQQVDDFSFVNTDDKSTPFSFLKYIFWNAGIDIDTQTGKQIFKHEVAHIQEKHTYDKLFVNIILIFFWCNPFFWLYRKEMNMIHEFIADKKAVEDSDTSSFAAMILQATYPQHRFELTNNFFYSPIKRRLHMLTKNKNPQVNYLGRVMVLPLAVLIFAAFTFKTKAHQKEDHTLPDNQSNVIERLVLRNDTIPLTLFVNTKHADANYLKSEEFKTRALVIVDSREIGNLGGNYLENSSNKYSTAVIYGPAEAKNIYGEKGRYGAIKLTEKEVIAITADSVFYDSKNKSIRLAGSNTTLKGDFSSTLIYIDSKIASPEELNKIPPAKISSINVLKGDQLEEIVGAKGKTAVIYVSLKPDDLPEVVVVAARTPDEQPVAIALDKMNVFYVGVDNPITIAVPGVPSDQLLVSIENGSITGGNGKYIVHVTHMGEATIKVATVRNDQKVLLSAQTFRVKMIPDPFAGKTAIDFEAKYRMDSSLFFRLKEQQLLPEQQNNLNQALVEKKVAGKKLSEAQMQYLDQKRIAEQQNKVNLALVEEKVAGKKLNEAQIQYLDQKRIAEQQNKENLDLKEKQLLANTSVQAFKNSMLYQQDLLAQQNDPLFTKVEQSPHFTGGDEAWRKYLVKNLNSNIPVDEGWKPGKYTLIVKFIVHTDGSVSNVETESYQGTKTARHCIQVIKNAPNWQPAIQNGKKVNAWKRQPITFLISEEVNIPEAKIFSVPLKVHLMNGGQITTYNMVGNGEFPIKPGTLYYLNGKITENPQSISSSAVIAMESYDAGSGLKYFGEKGKNGVLLLKTKS